MRRAAYLRRICFKNRDYWGNVIKDTAFIQVVMCLERSIGEFYHQVGQMMCAMDGSSRCWSVAST